MKTFWALIGVLALVTCGLFVFADPGGGGGSGGPTRSTGTRIAPMPAETAPPVARDVAAADPDGGGGSGAAVDSQDEHPAISTADPLIREVESVADGLEEMGIVVVEEVQESADAGEAPAEAVDGAPSAPDARDGERVVLDAILTQQTGEPGAEEPAGGGSVESDWIVSASDASDEAPAIEAAQDAPAEDEAAEVERARSAPSVTDDAPGETEVARDEPAVAPAGETGAPPSVTDGGREDAPAPSAPEGVGIGALDAIGAVVRQGAAQALPGPEGTVEVREDGSLLVNGTTVVTGKGTEEAPYEVSWDLLVTASGTFAPEKGKRLLPAWANALDGKWVRVRGYLLLPVMASDSKELLVMLNQWDGCCIGVPPSPYDAAEVRLTRSVDESVGGAGFVSYGTIKGKLDVDPYITGGWLLGLYVIEDAQIEVGSGTSGT